MKLSLIGSTLTGLVAMLAACWQVSVQTPPSEQDPAADRTATFEASWPRTEAGDNDQLAIRARGLLEAGFEFGRSWNSGDMLIERRDGFDSIGLAQGPANPDGALVERHELIRARFDFPNRRFLVLRAENAEVLDLSRQRDGLQSRKQLVALAGTCLDSSGTYHTKTFPHKARRLPRDVWHRGGNSPDLQSCLNQVGFPDLRGIPYGIGLGPSGFLEAAL